jgi:hypothetical protein
MNQASVSSPDVVLGAVLATLVRATADARTPVVLRTRRPAQADELARWLTRAHGSRREVIAAPHGRGPIVVRLPARIDWPAIPPDEESIAALPAAAPAAHLSPMAHTSLPRGTR